MIPSPVRYAQATRWVRADPRLGIRYARLQQITLQLDAGESRLQEVERLAGGLLRLSFNLPEPHKYAWSTMGAQPGLAKTQCGHGALLTV